MKKRAQDLDHFVVEDVRSFLFGKPRRGGMDLASLNIQRGRDLGLANYNAVREAYNLTSTHSFENVTKSLRLRDKLERLYKTPDKLDLWLGGISEPHIDGAAVGELFGVIIRDQFSRLMHCDKFFHLNDPDLAKEKLEGIIDPDEMTMAKIVEWNTNVRARRGVFVHG